MAAKISSKGEKEFSEAMRLKLSARIKAIRKGMGYDNYEQFAIAKNIARSQYGRYEKGADLKFSTLLKIVWAFDMTLAEFFSEGFDS